MVRKRKNLFLITPIISGILFLGILTFIQGCGQNFANACIGEYCAAASSWDSPSQDDDASNPAHQGNDPEGGVIGGNPNLVNDGPPDPPRRISFADQQLLSPMLLEPGG